MKPTVEIIFDRKGNEFEAGETVKGVVTFINTAEIRNRGIFVRCIGKCQTGYKKAEIEYYINDKVEVWPKEKTDECGKVLEAGRNEFPFEFVIPTGSPISFNGKHGSVEYYVEVEVDRVFRPSNYKFQRTFSVCKRNEGKHELRLDSMNASVVQSPFMFCKPDDFTLGVKCDRNLYRSGDVIHIQADIGNKSCCIVTGLRCSLVQEATLKGDFLCKSHKVSLVNQVEVMQKMNNEGPSTFTCQENLIIPADGLHSLQGCSMITLKYCLKIEALIKYGNPICVSIPLHIASPGTEKDTLFLADEVNSKGDVFATKE